MILSFVFCLYNIILILVLYYYALNIEYVAHIDVDVTDSSNRRIEVY